MSIIGPLVTPNTLETRFGRFAFIRAFKHPVVSFVAIAAIAAGVAAYASGLVHVAF
jgi:hypothetical protein